MNLVLNGKAYWAHVQSPEKYEDKEIGYSIMVVLEDKKLEELKAYLEKFFHENEPEKPMDTKVGANYPFKEVTSGGMTYEAVKAKTKHFFLDKTTGQRIDKTLPIFKSDGSPLEKGTLIGNGSTVQINVTPVVYHVTRKNYGVTLRLNGVMVNDLVAYGSNNAESFGFTVAEKSESEELLDGEMEF